VQEKKYLRQITILDYGCRPSCRCFVSINLECGSDAILFDFKFNFTHAYDDIKTYPNFMLGNI
jgi:hypothetical protein